VSERRTRHGFTLFEVMAAVAVLGFAVAMLARGAIAGMQYEGDASRRLAGSLIADRALFEVESALALGGVPPVGRQESEAGDEFLLAVEVLPLDPAQLGIGALFAPEPATPGSSPAPSQPGTPVSAAAAAPVLLLVSVRVAWLEGLAEQAVTRTTFAVDTTAAQQALGSGSEEATETQPPAAEPESAPEEEAP